MERVHPDRGGADVVAIGMASVVAVAVLAGITGGARSEAAYLYAPVAAVLAVRAPPRWLLRYGLVAAGSYAVAVAVGGELAAGPVALRVATAVATGAGARLLVDDVLRSDLSRSRALTTTTRRAELMAVVEEVAGSLDTVDPAEIVDVAVDGVHRLGFEHGWWLSSDGRGGWLPADRSDEVVPLPVAAAAVGANRQGHMAVLPGEGDTIVALPVGSDRVLAVEGSEPHGVRLEALEMLAAHVGRALDDAEQHLRERDRMGRLVTAVSVRDDLLGTLADNLRDALTIVRGAAETLDARWSATPVPLRRYLAGQIHHHAESLTTDLEALWRFQAASRGRVVAHLGPVALESVLAGVARRAECDPERLEVHVADSTVARADGRLLAESLDELVAAALERTTHDTPVRVSAHRNDDVVAVSVEDGTPAASDVDAPEVGAGGAALLTRRRRGIAPSVAVAPHCLRLLGSGLDVALRDDGGVVASFHLRTA